MRRAQSFRDEKKKVVAQSIFLPQWPVGERFRVSFSSPLTFWICQRLKTLMGTKKKLGTSFQQAIDVEKCFALRLFLFYIPKTLSASHG